MNGSELLKRWLASKPSEANRKEAEAVLKASGCVIRNGGEKHLIFSHPDLVGHPQFPSGTVSVNCHYKGKEGSVHPSGIQDIVKVVKYLKNQK